MQLGGLYSWQRNLGATRYSAPSLFLRCWYVCKVNKLSFPWIQFPQFKQSRSYCHKKRVNVLVMLEADLYVMIGQVVDEIALRLSSFSLKNKYIFKLVDAICQCIQAYVDTLEKLCCQELHKDMAKVHGNRPNYVSTFGCSRAVYIQVMTNLGTCFQT